MKQYGNMLNNFRFTILKFTNDYHAHLSRILIVMSFVEFKQKNLFVENNISVIASS